MSTRWTLRAPKKGQNEQSPNFLLCPEFCHEDCFEFCPKFFEDLSCSVCWERKITEKSLEILAIFTLETPRKSEQKNTNAFGKARKVRKPLKYRDLPWCSEYSGFPETVRGFPGLEPPEQLGLARPPMKDLKRHERSMTGSCTATGHKSPAISLQTSSALHIGTSC